MKKIIAFSASVALILTLTACGVKAAKEGTSSVTAEVVNVTQTAYRETKIQLPDHFKLPFISLHTVGEKCCFVYMNSENRCCMAVINDAGEIEKTAELFDTMSLGYSITVNADGTFTVIRTSTDFPLEFDGIGNISNYLDFRKGAKLEFFLDTYTIDGELIGECEIPDIAECFDKSSSKLNGICPYGDGRFIVSLSDKLVIIDSSGDLLSETNCDSGAVELSTDRDGRVIAADGGSYGYLDGATAALPNEMLEANEETAELMMYRDAPIAKGYGAFASFIQFRDGIYGITDDGERMLVFSFTDSFVRSSEVHCFAGIGDGKFIAASNDSLSLYTRYPDDYTGDRETVNLWMIDGGVSGEDAVEFAKANDRYIVNVEQNSKSLDDLVKAVLVDEGPDVIQINGSYAIDRLNNLGALADMSALMEQYGGIQRDDLMPNVVDALEDNGHIYALPQAFSVMSYFAASDYIGKEYTNWTYDDLYRFYADRPEGMYLTTNYFGGSFGQFAISNLDPWIDRATHSCRFDTPEFIRLLEFCRETEDSVFTNHADTADSGDTLFQKQLYSSLKEHKAMVCTENICNFGLSDLINAASYKGLDLDSATFMNLPESGGAGTMAMNVGYAIMENSKFKEGAWAYVSFLLGDERQCAYAENEAGWNFTNKKAFEKSLEGIICDGDSPDRVTMHTTDSNGITVDHEVFVNATKKQAEAYRDFVLNCTRFAITEPDITAIMAEEYDRYLGDEITAEECAERIQDRVMICLSEKS